MLQIQNQEYFNSVKKFAEDNGLLEKFQKTMDVLDMTNYC